jgi:hypothetical protein
VSHDPHIFRQCNKNPASYAKRAILIKVLPKTFKKVCNAYPNLGDCLCRNDGFVFLSILIPFMVQQTEHK